MTKAEKLALIAAGTLVVSDFLAFLALYAEIIESEKESANNTSQQPNIELTLQFNEDGQITVTNRAKKRRK